MRARGSAAARRANREPDDDPHWPCRIALRPRDPRDSRERGSARCQMQEFSAVEIFHRSPQSACTITTQYHAADGTSVTGTSVRRQNGLLLLLRVRAEVVQGSRTPE